jgi:hypothetical protein
MVVGLRAKLFLLLLIVFCGCARAANTLLITDPSMWEYVDAQILQGIMPVSNGAANDGWIIVQDAGFACETTTASCLNEYMVPTISGTVLAFCFNSGTNETILSVTGGSGWTVQPLSHLVDNTNGSYGECITSAAGTSGLSNLTLNLNGAISGGFYTDLFELLPPPGSTASFDTANTVSLTSCTSCQAASVSISTTDIIVDFIVNFTNFTTTPSFWTSPYISTIVNNGIGKNLTNGTGATATQSPTGPFNEITLAFKSTAGLFTPPAEIQSLHGLTIVSDAIDCTPICSAITLTPAPTPGDLLFIQAADENSGQHITSISDGHSGGYTVPSGANTCQNTGPTTNNDESCGYSLSVPSSVTQLTITMNSTGFVGFLIWDVHKSSGVWSFDSQNSLTTSSTSQYISCPSLSITGKNDAIFQAAIQTGSFAVSSPSFYPFAWQNSSWGNPVLVGAASGALGLNYNKYYQCVWESNETPSALYSIAFK